MLFTQRHIEYYEHNHNETIPCRFFNSQNYNDRGKGTTYLISKAPNNTIKSKALAGELG